MKLLHEQILEKKSKNLARTWRNGDQVLLTVGDMKWEIQIARNGDSCFLGRGWSKFAMDTGVEASDIIIFYTYESKDIFLSALLKTQTMSKQNVIQV